MKMLDAEDRELLLLWLIRVGGGGAVVVAGAAVAGLAVRVFGFVAG